MIENLKMMQIQEVFNNLLDSQLVNIYSNYILWISTSTFSLLSRLFSLFEQTSRVPHVIYYLINHFTWITIYTTNDDLLKTISILCVSMFLSLFNLLTILTNV